MSEGQRAATMAAGQLRAIVERVERLAEEKKAVMATEFVKHHLGLLQAARAAKAEVVA